LKLALGAAYWQNVRAAFDELIYELLGVQLTEET
jgi:hypothetical protein